jgi:hypothetical protein
VESDHRASKQAPADPMSAASVTNMLKIHCGPQQQTIYAQKPSLFEVPLNQTNFPAVSSCVRERIATA